ncbi:hypothetical protein [Rhodococcus pyridinivorans]|uniref:Uncharacterized protein n=1 Tax=Rhodococcus pyridinivorans TaxID=103816 RepID=A0A7M2XIL1_9NOCA|nr:hypothetical protein [Rhodococcus pyridinivorans]QOV97604.1 hypothetical protein INP59_16910 [Rhodococcus pyridinivorans]
MSEAPIEIGSRTSSNVKRFGGTSSRMEPYRFILGDSPEFEVHEPDTGTMLEIQSEKTTLRQGLRLLLLDQYDDAEPYIEALSWDEFIEWQRDLFEYFGLDARRFEERQAVNRFERRRRRR